MENRRQTYRHPFLEPGSIEVEIAAADGQQSLRGEILDLSVEGMKVRLEAKNALELGGQLTILLIRRQTPPVHLPLRLVGQVKHIEPDGRYICLGVQFLELATASAGDSGERKLSRFLAEEQRRILRHRIAVENDRP